MNTRFVEKYDELFTEFTRYVVERPEFANENLRRVKKYLRHDDKPARPVIYVQVG